MPFPSRKATIVLPAFTRSLPADGKGRKTNEVKKVRADKKHRKEAVNKYQKTVVKPKTKARWPDKKAGLGVWPAGGSIFLS